MINLSYNPIPPPLAGAAARLLLTAVYVFLSSFIAAASAAPSVPLPGETLHFTTYVSGQTPGFSAGEAPQGIVVVPGGEVWFSESAGQGATPGIAKLNARGRVTEYATGTGQTSQPYALVQGADANIWFADIKAGLIGRITPTGTIKRFKQGLSRDDVPAGMTLGSDGAVWFVSQGQGPYVGKIDVHGTIVEVAHLSASLTAEPSLAQDPHGDFWLTASNNSNEVLVRVSARGHVAVRTLKLQPGLNPCCVYTSPQGSATRRDGSIWITNLFYANARSGNHPLLDIASDKVRLVYCSLQYIGSVARGKADDLWFADQDPFLTHAAIGKISLSGEVRAFQLPRGDSPISIAIAADGSAWMTALSGNGAGAVIHATR